MISKPMDKTLSLRLDGKKRTAFHKEAKKYGNPSDILREIIEAFIDRRLVIQSDPKKENLYVTRN